MKYVNSIGGGRCLVYVSFFFIEWLPKSGFASQMRVSSNRGSLKDPRQYVGITEDTGVHMQNSTVKLLGNSHMGSCLGEDTIVPNTG